MSDIFGLLGAIFSSACAMVGLPNQIFKNYKNQNCKGLSFWLAFFAFFSHSSWIGYGLSKPDIFLCISQIPGSIFMMIILIQFWMYKNRKQKKTKGLS